MNRLRLLSYIVMAYMLMAFTWWTLLLFTKNRDAFYAKAELLKIGMVAEGLVKNQQQFEQTAGFQELSSKFRRQERMIFGEAAMFVLTLLAGLWFIHKSYSREMASNQQRRNFLLSITHELKSPISSIRLVLETLLKRDLPKTQTDRLAASALQENERLHELVENLLLSAKLETAYQPNFEPVNLAELLEDIVEKMKEKHLEARFAFKKPEHFPMINLDRAGITSVVGNLLENAVKYALGVPDVEVRLQSERSKMAFEIADRGMGIPDQEKGRVFDKFYRIGSEETRQAKGTGLGLFIVREVVRAHKGSIRILDNTPSGAIFRIELPVSPA